MKALIITTIVFIVSTYKCFCQAETVRGKDSIKIENGNRIKLRTNHLPDTVFIKSVSFNAKDLIPKEKVIDDAKAASYKDMLNAHSGKPHHKKLPILSISSSVIILKDSTRIFIKSNN